MNSYYLQRIAPSLEGPSRQLIDSHIWPGAYPLNSCLAPTWLDAKEKLGFPLSPMQNWVRENKEAVRDASWVYNRPGIQPHQPKLGNFQ